MIHSAAALAAEVRAAFASAAMTRPHVTMGYEFRMTRERPEKASGAAPRWFVTPHAVGAFQRRASGAGGMSYEQALGAIVNESRVAHKVKDLHSGAELWRGPKPRRLRYIVAPDDTHGLPVLVTVLGSHDRMGQ